MPTFRRLLIFLRPYRVGLALSALLAIGALTMTVLIPWLTGRGIDAIEQGERDELSRFGLLIALAAIGRLALNITRRLVSGQVSLGVELDLRRRLYGHLMALDLGFFDRRQTGQLMSRATVDLGAVRFFLGYGLVLLMQAILTLLLAIVAMFLLDAELAAVALLPAPLIIWLSGRYSRIARPAQQEVQQQVAELTAVAEESIGGVRVIKAFAREDRQLARFRAATARVFERSMRATRLNALFQPLIGFLPQLGLAAVLLIGGRRVIAGEMTIGAFAAFYSYLLILTGPVRGIGMALGWAQRATAAGVRLFEVLDRPPAITAPPQPLPLPNGGGAISLRNVSFTYVGAAAAAIDRLDLEIEAGRTIALVGGTGAGKTTLAALIARLYDVDSGAVVVDGVDVRAVDPLSLRSQIAVVDDSPFLFSATIAENIAYADATSDRARIEAAAHTAGAHDFIVELADGYDTAVGERGLTLSGGQRQRIAIARAILAEPRILILDDATSAVDAATEQLIKPALRAAMSGRTTLIIAHRLSTIALADEIVVLENGRLSARGSHNELIERSPLYAEIVEKGLPDQLFQTTDLNATLKDDIVSHSDLPLAAS